MLVYWSQTFTSTSTASMIKAVTCECCGCEFAYQMVRRYTGQGRSVYSLDNAGARQRAVGSSQATVQAALHQQEDPVACPRCGLFQGSMIEKNLRRNWRWTPWGSGSNIDPARAGQPRGHFPGTPTAVRIGGRGGLPDESACERAPDVQPDGSIAIRLGRDPLAEECCVCLGPAETGFRVGVLEVPVCRGCLKEGQRMRSRRGLKICLLPAGILIPAGQLALYLGVVAGGVELGDAAVGTTMIVGLASAFVAAVISMVLWSFFGSTYALPALHRGYDAISLVCWVSFANPMYAEKTRQTIARTPVAWAKPAAVAG